MKLGDMIQHFDADCGTGIIVEIPYDLPVREWQDPPDILVLWSDGTLEYCDPLILEMVR